MFLVLAMWVEGLAGRGGAWTPESCSLLRSWGWITMLLESPYCSKRKLSSPLCCACRLVVEHCFIWFLRSRLKSSWLSSLFFSIVEIIWRMFLLSLVAALCLLFGTLSVAWSCFFPWPYERIWPPKSSSSSMPKCCSAALRSPLDKTWLSLLKSGSNWAELSKKKFSASYFDLIVSFNWLSESTLAPSA